jgi:diguanylate cyclase (GGDEF)-like protein/PAS domain S-box-containing protein
VRLGAHAAGQSPKPVDRVPARLAGREVHPEDRLRYRESLLRAARALVPWEWAGRVRSADGGAVYVLATCRPRLESAGAVEFSGRVLEASPDTIPSGENPLAEELASSSLVALYDRDLRLVRIEGPMVNGLNLDALVGQPISAWFSASTMRVIQPATEAALRGETTRVLVEEESSGRILAAHFAPVRDRRRRITGVVGHWQDLTAQQALQRAHAAALERFRIAFERAPIGMLMLTLDGRVERANAAFCELCGYTEPELVALSPFALVHSEDRERVEAQYASLRESRLTTFDFRLEHGRGHPLWVQATINVVTDEQGVASGVLAHVQDISERRRYEDRLRYAADHDPLTGLLNRRGLEAALAGHLAYCRRYGARGALLVLDLDGFKFVNDTLGHMQGDEVISGLAQALAQRLRESDTIARLGGDEFAVLLPTQSEGQTRVVCRSLLEQVRRHAAELPHANTGRLTASIGVALLTEATVSVDELLIDADLAMYDAKAAGGNRYALYGSAARGAPKLKAQMAWMERIEQALAHGRFTLHAQPIGVVPTGSPSWHEVLVRMVGDDGDLIPPTSFLEVAERFGAIREIDRWVVRTAIAAMGGVHARGVEFPLSVNISGLSAGDPELLVLIDEQLRAHGVVPSQLTLEVTETAAVGDMVRARRFARALGEIGCRLALDDFGSGYGSFHYLKHLPFDVLKIDGEFVRQAVRNPADRLVIKALSEIARGLGKQTVAEFVENAATMALLARYRVDYAQGFHLGPPEPLAGVIERATAAAPQGTRAQSAPRARRAPSGLKKPAWDPPPHG